MQQQELSACSRLVRPGVLPCWGQKGSTWHARACWVPQYPVTVTSLLDSAVRTSRVIRQNTGSRPWSTSRPLSGPKSALSLLHRSGGGMLRY